MNMLTKQDIKKVNDCLWEIPASFRADMQVPARIYASEKMLDDALLDRSLWQLVNVATLPGIVEAAIVMPDVHEGYGFPIGGVAAFSYPDGVVSPGGIGYDINCGVRLLIAEHDAASLGPYVERLARELYRSIPSGIGRGGGISLGERELYEVLAQGVEWLSPRGYVETGEEALIESRGRLANADPEAVSELARKRGIGQLGTLGAGNHFVEIERVDEIFNDRIAREFGLEKDLMVVLIHTGSRGMGHQIATDYVRTMVRAMPLYGIELPDRELACAPLSSPEGTAYFNAMAAAANFAWANRQCIAWRVRTVWRNLLGDAAGKLRLLYDVAHNIAKIETHTIGGRERKLIVHRKGATRAFGPHHSELAKAYQDTGQPVIVPGSMGTASYVMAGTEAGMRRSFGSSCHGAGRRMSRHAAKRKMSGRALREALAQEGISVCVRSMRDLAEEAPFAYKDVHEVVDVIEQAGLAQKIARLKPVAVIKG